MNNFITKKRLLIIGGVIAGVAVVGSAFVDSKDDDGGGKRLTLVEVACDMLNDGKDADFTFEVTRDLAEDHPATYADADVAARLALFKAQNQGCG